MSFNGREASNEEERSLCHSSLLTDGIEYIGLITPFAPFMSLRPLPGASMPSPQTPLLSVRPSRGGWTQSTLDARLSIVGGEGRNLRHAFETP